jgi:hypothetical protein
LQANGQIRAWGRVDESGNYCVNVPELERDQRYLAISAGYYHSIALRSDKKIITWGIETTIVNNALRQVPNVPAGRNIVALSAGNNYSLALLDNGQVLGWGSNYQISEPPPAPSAKCTRVAICAGDRHVLALCKDGTTVDWGYVHDERQMFANVGVPKRRRCVAISASKYSNQSLVLLDNGQVVDYQKNMQEDEGFTRKLVIKDRPVVAVSAGPGGCLYLDRDGNVGCWNNDFRHLTVSCRGGGGDVPAPPQGSKYVAISTGGGHHLALRDDGVVVGWGDNRFGQARDIRELLPTLEQYMSTIEEIFGAETPKVQELRIVLDVVRANLTAESVRELQNKVVAFSNRYLNKPQQLGNEELLDDENWQCSNANDLIDQMAYPDSAEKIADVPPKDFLRLHNVCWNMKELVLLIKETLHGRNANIADPEYMRQKRLDTNAVPPTIWQDDYEKHALLAHPGGRGEQLATLLDTKRATVANIVSDEMAQQFYEIGSLFWARGEPFQRELRNALTADELQEWMRLKQGLREFDMPLNMPPPLKEKIDALKAAAHTRLGEYWRGMHGANEAAARAKTAADEASKALTTVAQRNEWKKLKAAMALDQWSDYWRGIDGAKAAAAADAAAAAAKAAKLATDEQDAMLFLMDMDRSVFEQCIRGDLCIMSVGKSMLKGYNVWVKFKGRPQIIIPGLPIA